MFYLLNSECHDSQGRPISGGAQAIDRNCTHFTQCSSGVLVTKKCPDDQAFNPDTNHCDHPWNVEGCGEQCNCHPPEYGNNFICVNCIHCY